MPWFDGVAAEAADHAEHAFDLGLLQEIVLDHLHFAVGYGQRRVRPAV